MNALTELVRTEKLDPLAVLWWCRDHRLISDLAPDLEGVMECDAIKAVEAIRKAREARDAK